MTEQKIKNNIVIPLDEKSENVLIEIVKKHKLEETENQAFEKVKLGKHFNDGLIINLVRELLLDKINNIQFLNTLQSELKITREKTKNLSLDIINDLIPLLKKIPADKLQEYSRQKRDDDERLENNIRVKELINRQSAATAQELLIAKLKGSIPDDDFDKKEIIRKGLEKPYEVKKVEVKDVEEVAKNIKKQREETAHPSTTGAGLQNKGQTDRYREATE